MGKSTDQLVKLAHQISTNPSRREMDMLSTGEQVSIAQEYGIARIGTSNFPDWRTGGIVTEAEHSRARILHIQPERISRPQGW